MRRVETFTAETLRAVNLTPTLAVNQTPSLTLAREPDPDHNPEPKPNLNPNPSPIPRGSASIRLGRDVATPYLLVHLKYSTSDLLHG